MARKKEPGITYYPMNADHINNSKVKLLVNEFDSHGYWIYNCLLAEIYARKGYYMDLNDQDYITLFANDVVKKPVSLVEEVIKGCVRRGLFDKSVFDVFNSLTSDRIQENYLEATHERRKKGTVLFMAQEIVLIDISSCKNVELFSLKNDSSREIRNSSRDKPPFFPGASTQSKVEYSRVKESRVERGASHRAPTEISEKNFQPPELQQVQIYFLELESTADLAAKFHNYYSSNGWRVGKNPMKDWKASVRKWLTTEKDFKPHDKPDSSASRKIGRVSVDKLDDFVNRRSIPGSK